MQSRPFIETHCTFCALYRTANQTLPLCIHLYAGWVWDAGSHVTLQQNEEVHESAKPEAVLQAWLTWRSSPPLHVGRATLQVVSGAAMARQQKLVVHLLGAFATLLLHPSVDWSTWLAAHRMLACIDRVRSRDYWG